MRWFIGTLVAINLGILMWSWLGTEERPQGELAAPGVGSIRLMGEAATSPEPVAVPIPAPPRDNGATTAPAMPEADIRAAVNQAVGDEGKPAAAVVSPVPTAEVPVISMPEPAFVAEPDTIAAQPTMFCNRIGPFADAAATEPVSKYLKSRGEVTTREDEVKTRVGFWVMIPPQPTRAAAEAIAARLKAKGITDLWVISKGEARNAISLGVFSQNDNAESFVRLARDKGFEAEIRDKTKSTKALWLDYQGKAFIPPAEIRSRAPDGVTVTEQDCP